MATNRLYVRCTICLEEIPIARISAGTDEWVPARNDAADWAAFLETHQEHDGTLHVELTSESDYLVVLGGGVAK